jgi:hypothetical protein
MTGDGKKITCKILDYWQVFLEFSEYLQGLRDEEIMARRRVVGRA